MNWTFNFLFSKQQRVISSGNITPFLPINRGVPQGTILGPILFSVMLNDVQPINVTRSTLVKLADDLTSFKYYGKGKAGLCPQEVESILIWAEDNLMTINLTKIKEMVVRDKVHGETSPLH